MSTYRQHIDNVLIADIGISKDLKDVENILPGNVPGSPIYMSIEQILVKPVDSRGNQYILGLTGSNFSDSPLRLCLTLDISGN